MSARPIFERTRPARDGQGLDGVTVRVSASVDRDEHGEPWVTVTWERDDFEAKGMQPVRVTITVEEFQGIATGIVDALDQPKV